MPIRQCACQPQHVDAARAQVGGMPQVDQDPRALGADGTVQETAEMRFGGRTDLLSDLDQQPPGVTADRDR
ncbi:hypothetical protein DI272_41825 [Streptomyces sp. Act143]|uniref:hypothetical protein n=1 Tax=Streptomyces sp. Act143 TaxID=2200760 RepID=UPI000D674D0C|nr:hypothetical protein [Streptomyces sp. Act143]PWI19984.1 hypothetical protein DI272_41825 [Streptomyces sp. Act143]